MFREREGDLRERSFTERSNRKRVHGDRQRETSVFVLNLPRWLDKYGLYGIFQKAGQVYDTYIPRQNIRRGIRKYGFVRFRREEDVNRCIKLFHGAMVRGNKLIVTKAKPKRKIQQKSQYQNGQQHLQRRFTARSRWIWRPKVRDAEQRGKETEANDARGALGLSVKGEINKDNEEWLHRSLVGRVEEPRELASLSSAIQGD